VYDTINDGTAYRPGGTVSEVLTKQSPFEREIAQLIIDTLHLEDVRAEEVEPGQPLFREGLGLDSIDALELALAITQRYGCQLRSDDASNVEIFASLSALSTHIAHSRVT